MTWHERKRRFYPGWQENVCGIEFRCERGVKGPDDLVLLWQVDGEFVPFILDICFLAIDCISENEDVLYAPPAKGGEYTVQAVKDARLRGWRYAVEKLHRERGEKQRRLEEADAT